MAGVEPKTENIINEDSPRVRDALRRASFTSLSDLFVAHPTFDLYAAADYLDKETDSIAPIDLEKTLRDECRRRNDFHFFARITLFTALNEFDGMGWTEQHYMLFGMWPAILGDDHDDFADKCWDFLERRLVMNGWKPESIFDPIIDEALAEVGK